MIGLVLAGTAVAPGEGRDVLVIAMPWADPAAALRAVAEAGGQIVGTGTRPFVILARSDEPGLVGRLYRAGAGLVLDARATGTCFRFKGDVPS
ncbi:hypothetical protein [Prosthecomicrobium sp. N25]|uniref:hypothetical protein n=1 Tax=Prosthecomicrobium sp. N25 TaxID=3129254 RepID=UPI003077AD55